jgi:DNA-binding response OmpR family regulator
MMLDREGYETIIAPDADAGIEAFESFQFDLAVVDIFLPGTSGLSTIAEFRRRAPTVPILAMSGFRFRDAMEPGLDFLGMAALAGAVVCLRKPFESRQLITAVRASLDRQLPVSAP